jgi:hypothetical protein
MADVPHPDGELKNSSVHQEPSDVNWRWILIAGGVFLAIAVLIHAGMWWYFTSRERSEARAKRSTFPLAAGQADTPPPEPRLEQIDRMAGNEKPNVTERRAAAASELSSYGSTSEKGYVRIPIDRAMKLVLRQLRAREESPKGEDKTKGLAEGGESNSGRMYRGKGK